jgi:hypothetical protein
VTGICSARRHEASRTPRLYPAHQHVYQYDTDILLTGAAVLPRADKHGESTCPSLDDTK